MGLTVSGVRNEQVRNAQINNDIQQEELEKRNTVKLLLLGKLNNVPGWIQKTFLTIPVLSSQRDVSRKSLGDSVNLLKVNFPVPQM